jgi:hypothetical protein
MTADIYKKKSRFLPVEHSLTFASKYDPIWMVQATRHLKDELVFRLEESLGGTDGYLTPETLVFMKRRGKMKMGF